MTSPTRLCSALAAVLLLCGCAKPIVRSVPMTLPLPARPTLTPVDSDAVQCLAPAAYTALVTRERALATWGMQLEAIIQTNNQHAQGK